MNNGTFTSGQVADMCAVSKTTVARWVASGRIPAFHTPGGHRRIHGSDLYRFLKELNIPVPAQVLEAAENSSKGGKGEGEKGGA